MDVLDDLRLDGNKSRGKFVFSRNAKATEVFNDIVDGFIDETSVKAIPLDVDDDGDTITVTRWKFKEGSVVTFGADQSVGIHRAESTQEGISMPDDKKPGGGAAPDDGENVNVSELRISRQRNLKEGKQQGIQEERERVSGIRKLFSPHLHRGQEYMDFMDSLIDQNVSIKRATDMLLEALADESIPLAGQFEQDTGGGSLDRATQSDLAPMIRKPTSVAQRGGDRLAPGLDQRDKYNDVVEKTLLVRVGATNDKEIVRQVHESEYASMLVSELARDFLNRNRIDCKGVSKREQIIGMAMSRDLIISHGTSDFANILANVANKSMLLGYEESAETWPMIARVISVPDFKANTFTGLSEFGSLPIVLPNGEYTYGTMGDRAETAQLATYGQLFSISRQALANDDLGALGMTPRKIGRAASRTVGDGVYAILTGNPTLAQDSTSLFDASTHGNLIANGNGAPPSVTTLDAARVAIATQKDSSSSATSLNIRMQRLIVPVALQTTADILRTADKDPAEGASTSFNAPNPFRNTFEVVADARLDDADSAHWYASADPNVTDTIGACFLNGQTQPYLEQQEGFTVDGMVYKGRIDCVAVALDFRGLYSNDGN